MTARGGVPPAFLALPRLRNVASYKAAQAQADPFVGATLQRARPAFCNKLFCRGVQVLSCELPLGPLLPRPHLIRVLAQIRRILLLLKAAAHTQRFVHSLPDRVRCSAHTKCHDATYLTATQFLPLHACVTMARGLGKLVLAVILLMSAGPARGQEAACPPAPTVARAQIHEACASAPASTAIGCSMYALCNDGKSPAIWPVLCQPWRIASSLCADDATIRAIPLCTK